MANELLTGAMQGLAAGLRGYTEAKVWVAQARTEQEQQRAQMELEQRRVNLQELLVQSQERMAGGERASRERILGTQADLQKTLETMRQAGETGRLGMTMNHAIAIQKLLGGQQLDQIEAKNLGDLANTIIQTSAQTKAVEIGAGAQTKAAEIGAGAQTKAAEIGAGAQTKAAEIGAGAQTKVAEIGAGAQTKVAEIAAGTKTTSPIVLKAGETAVVMDSKGQLVGQFTSPVETVDGASKATEGQRTTAIYASRLVEAEDILTRLESDPELVGKLTGKMANLPIIGKTTGIEAFRSEDIKLYQQAQQNFVNAVLRKESGAVINDEEFKKAAKQYFPQPGDTVAVIAQKKANRQNVLLSFINAAGSAYQANQSAPPSTGGTKGIPLAPPLEGGNPPAPNQMRLSLSDTQIQEIIRISRENKAPESEIRERLLANGATEDQLNRLMR